MATVTGLTAARTLALLDTMIVDASLLGDDLILTKEDGTTINVGPVIGPEGPAGPAGLAGPAGPAGPAGEGGSGSTPRVVLGADVVNNNAVADTLQDVTGLEFPVVAGQRYRFRFVIDYDSANALNGTRWTLNGPSFSRLSYVVTHTNGGTAQVVRYSGQYNASSIGTGSAANPNIAIIEGIIAVNTSGTIIARFSGEDAGIAVTARAGSFVEFTEVVAIPPSGNTLDSLNHYIDDMKRPRYIKDFIGTDPSLVHAVNSTWRTYDPVTGVTFSSTSGTQDFTIIAKELQMIDQRIVSKFRFGHGTVTAGNLLKVRSVTLGLLCYVDPSQLFIFMGTSGAGGALSGSGPIAVPLSLNTDYWLESSIVGNLITHKVYDADPDIGSPTPRGTITHTLTSLVAGSLGTGRHGSPGIRGAPNATAGATVNFRQVRMTAL